MTCFFLHFWNLGNSKSQKGGPQQRGIIGNMQSADAMSWFLICSTMHTPSGAAQQGAKRTPDKPRERIALSGFVRRNGGRCAPVSGTTYPYSVMLSLLNKEFYPQYGIEAPHASDSDWLWWLCCIEGIWLLWSQLSLLFYRIDAVCILDSARQFALRFLHLKPLPFLVLHIDVDEVIWVFEILSLY